MPFMNRIILIFLRVLHSFIRVFLIIPTGWGYGFSASGFAFVSAAVLAEGHPLPRVIYQLPQLF